MKLVTFGVDIDRSLIVQLSTIHTAIHTTDNIIPNRDCTSSNHRSKHAHTFLHTSTGR